MLTNIKKKDICMYFVFNDEITTAKLSEIGCSKYDIEKLIQDKKLVRDRRGVYKLASTDPLFKLYSNVLCYLDDKTVGLRALKKCYKEKPNDGQICSRIFLNKIQLGDYSDIFDYFKVLDNTTNKVYKQDSNLYLLLLSYIVEIPEEYRTRVLNMSFEDIKVLEDDKRFHDKYSQNRTRLDILKAKFKPALETLKFDHHWDKIITSLIIERLLDKALKVKRAEFYDIKNYVKKHNYEEVVNMLNKISSYRDLDYSEELTLTLCNRFIGIKNGFRCEKIEGEAYCLSQAIQLYDYKKALEFATEKDKYKDQNNKNNVIILILNDIINELEKDKPILFTDVILAINSGKIDEISSKISGYLKANDSSIYERYILDLVKISLLEKDSTFFEPMVALSSIKQGTFEFDPSVYLQDYYIALSNGKIDKARAYLDIISQTSKLGGIIFDCKDLEASLEKMEKHLNEDEMIESRRLASELEDNYCDEADDDNKYAMLSDVITNVVDSQGLVVLEELSDEDKNKVMEITSQVKDIMITSTTDSRLVLRYFSPGGVYIDMKQLLRRGNKSFNNGDYDDCISCFTLASSKLREPRNFIYKKLGLSYLNRGNGAEDYKKAIDYLTVARGMGDAVERELATARENIIYDGAKVVQYTKK